MRLAGAVVSHRERLGEAFGLVVDAAGSGWVHVAAVVLWLRMDGRVAVDLAGRGEEEAGTLGPGQLQEQARSFATGRQGGEGPGQVGGRGGRRGQVDDRVDGAVDLGANAHVG